MGFPDRIERTVELAHPPAKVWAALTTAEGLAAWFGEEAAIDLRRQAFHAFFARLPAEALRPGLTNAVAADTAWVIASPDVHDLLVCQAGYSYDQLEELVGDTLGAALLGGTERH